MDGKLRAVLDDAAAAGLVAPEKAGPLTRYLLARGVGITAAPEMSDNLNPDEESEMPRFIRGYHDILITIGIVATLVAVGGLWSVFAALVGTIVLAEIFVRRQRLALPSFVLTIACLITGSAAVWSVLDVSGFAWLGAIGSGLKDHDADYVVVAGVNLLILAAFYWRYRVPVALASMLVTGVLAILGFLALFLFPGQRDAALHFVLLTGGSVLGLMAILQDLRDPERVTRRSDVAFWLYLVAVPAILKTAFDLIDPTQGASSAVVMVVLVAIMMLLGLIMDRRAFVTAGLIYLGYAFSTLLKQGFLGGRFASIGGESHFLFLLLAIGIIVLGFGIGWRLWRRLLISRLPHRWLEKLPKVR